MFADVTRSIHKIVLTEIKVKQKFKNELTHSHKSIPHTIITSIIPL